MAKKTTQPVAVPLQIAGELGQTGQGFGPPFRIPTDAQGLPLFRVSEQEIRDAMMKPSDVQAYWRVENQIDRLTRLKGACSAFQSVTDNMPPKMKAQILQQREACESDVQHEIERVLATGRQQCGTDVACHKQIDRTADNVLTSIKACVHDETSNDCAAGFDNVIGGLVRVRDRIVADSPVGNLMISLRGYLREIEGSGRVRPYRDAEVRYSSRLNGDSPDEVQVCDDNSCRDAALLPEVQALAQDTTGLRADDREVLKNIFLLSVSLYAEGHGIQAAVNDWDERSTRELIDPETHELDLVTNPANDAYTRRDYFIKSLDVYQLPKYDPSSLAAIRPINFYDSRPPWDDPVWRQTREFVFPGWFEHRAARLIGVREDCDDEEGNCDIIVREHRGAEADIEGLDYPGPITAEDAFADPYNMIPRRRPNPPRVYSEGEQCRALGFAAPDDVTACKQDLRSGGIGRPLTAAEAAQARRPAVTKKTTAKKTTGKKTTGKKSSGKKSTAPRALSAEEARAIEARQAEQAATARRAEEQWAEQEQTRAAAEATRQAEEQRAREAELARAAPAAPAVPRTRAEAEAAGYLAVQTNWGTHKGVTYLPPGTALAAKKGATTVAGQKLVVSPAGGRPVINFQANQLDAAQRDDAGPFKIIS